MAIRAGLLPLGLALCLATSPAWSSAITVVNASFEDLPAGGLATSCGGDCAYSLGVGIPGWVTTPSGGPMGQFAPGSALNTYFNYLTDGSTVGYSNNGVISQTVAPTAIAGATYTLLVDVGFRKEQLAPGVVKFDIGATEVTATGTPDVNSGNWATYTATYTATAGDAGAALTIVLSSLGVQGDWDNVRLSVTTPSTDLPEPGSLALLAVGLAGLAVRRSRRAAA